MEHRQEDLRVKKTKAAIRNAFKDMICEMDYDQITIKELAYRAQINRKHFIFIIRVLKIYWQNCRTKSQITLSGEMYLIPI